MTKAELIELVQAEAGEGVTKKQTGEIIEAAIELIKKAVKKEKRFNLADFGTFTVRTRKARTGRNPQTGATLKIKASKTVGFKPAPGFKDML